MPRMECSITDGPQHDDLIEGVSLEEDEDGAYELVRQKEIDDAPKDDIEAEERMEGEHFPPCCEPQELAEMAAEMERPDED